VASLLTNARKHSLGNNQFPARTSKTRGQGRHKDHEYPRQRGANTEKQARGLWIWTLEIPAHWRLTGYARLVQDTIPALKRLFETQETVEFVHPVDGVHRAWITTWDQDLRGDVVSGYEVSITVQEDLNPDFSLVDIAQFGYARVAGDDIASILASLRADLTAEELGTDTSIFDQIVAAADEFFSLFDAANLGSRLLEAKLERLTQLINKADATATLLLSPHAWPLTHALARLMSALVDITTTPGGLFEYKSFIVPRNMSVADAAVAIWRDASRAKDLLGLNVIENPTEILAGTTLRY
jgi:hypothetical protein